MKSYLVESWKSESIYSWLFDDQPFLTDVQVLPFSSWLDTQSTLETDSFELLSAYHCLASIQGQLSLLKEMLQYPAFIQQALDFYHTLIEYDIDFDTLPETTPQYKEMKLILRSLQPLITPGHQLQEVRHQKTRLQDVILDNASITSLGIQKTVAACQQRGLIIKEAPLISNQTIEFYHALNARQEIEACAQKICQLQLPLNQVNVILCGFTDTLPYLKTIFNHYHLDFGVAFEQVNSRIVEAFVLLSRWFMQPDLESFQALVSSPLFEKYDTAAILEYISLFIEELDLSQPAEHVKNSVGSVPHLAAYQKDYLLHLEQAFEQFRQWQLPLLTANQENTPLICAYDLLRNSDLIQDKEEKACLLKIQHLLNSTQSPYLSKQEIEIVLSVIANIKKNISSSYQFKLCVTDMSHPVLERPYCFILNGNSKNYPGNAALSGIFEEEYAAAIPNYPTKVERASFFNEQRKWIFQAGRHLILSYATNTYEGKGLECAFEIKSYAKQPSQLWPLLQNNQLIPKNHTLCAETAHSLFLRNNRLYGSISSFERHFRCPYSYFLHTGLKLRQLSEIEVDQAMIGSIQHACIEECINRYGHQYAAISTEELHSLVEESFHALEDFFITSTWRIESIKERCIDSLISQLEFLKDFETNTDLTHHQCEVAFEHVLFKEETIAIELRGIIDRIDSNLNLLRVLDYKSSAKSLNTKKMEAGLQLQLITYLYIAAETMKQKPAGAYYYSLKNNDIPITAARLNLRNNELLECGHEDYYSEWMKAHRLSGKTTDASMENDNNGKHIMGWNAKGPTSTQLVDFDVLKEELLMLYRTLRKRLLSGVIDCTPVEGACTFCDFGSICRYNGLQYKKNITIEEMLEESEDHA